MDKEPLRFYVVVNLTEHDKKSLEVVARERGATLSGLVRKLIRDAVNPYHKGDTNAPTR